MKSQYVNELAIGARVDSIFSIVSREYRSTRSGDAFLFLRVADRSGRVDAVWFRPTGEGAEVPVGGVVRVRGTVTVYRGSKRVSIETLRPAATFELSDLLPATTRSQDELVSAFRDHVKAVRDPELRRILKAVFGQKDFFQRFCQCPGAQSHHHAYLGGLLEHTVAVSRAARSLSLQYEGVDADLLLAAALLHDIGKVDELRFDTSFTYTDEGRLLGHVVLGLRRLRDALVSSSATQNMDRVIALEHAILSHHGELEWGSPKRPSTIEALLLHHIDNLDAKAAGFSAILSRATAAEEAWTDADNLFRRPLYAPMQAEQAREYRVEEDDQYVRRSA